MTNTAKPAADHARGASSALTASLATSIPDDVYAIANRLEAEMRSNHRLSVYGLLLRAIMDERERAAKVADQYAKAKAVRRARELTTQEVYEVKIFARLIAAEIRLPTIHSRTT